MIRLTRCFTVLILFSVLFGCTQPSLLKENEPNEPNELNEQPIQDPAETAKRLEKQGEYQKAAQEYLRIAGQSIPPTRQDYQFLAIKAFLKVGMLAEAKAELAKFDVKKSYQLEIPLKLVRAKIGLEEQRVSEAEQQLKGIEPATLPMPLQIEYQQLHAYVIAAKGNVLEANREFRELERLTNNDPAVIKENQRRLWKSLSSLNKGELKQLEPVQDNMLSGWIALALLAKTPYPKHLQPGINDWQRRFPNHPATPDVVPGLVQQLEQMPPPQIALLLPSPDSQFGEFAKAIKNGFSIAAQSEMGNNRPEITLYDVDAENIVATYQKAVDAGADFVVGPLLKYTLAVLAESQSQLPIPTLGLNHLGIRITTGNLYQLGVSPEDEAKEVARRAWADGYKTALVLVPNGDWGERILETFLLEWEPLGGQLAKQHIYGDNFQLFIPQILEDVKTADMVFMVALPEQARQIRPLFDLELDGHLPIYSISKVYSGTPNPELDIELEGVMFVDMPWVLAPDEYAVQLQAELLEFWPEEGQKHKRLHALGIDAYHSLLQLQQLNQQWQGQIGHLSVDNRGVITREQLRWARFVNGEPQLLE